MSEGLWLKTLRLVNFRLYGDEVFHFEQGVNLLWGGNGEGKTSILEGIYLLMTGRSFRASQLSDLINLNGRRACIEGEFIKHGISQTIKILLQGKLRQLSFNQTKCPSFSHLWGVIPGVVMTPDDNDLIKGGPATRRRFLDLQLVQMDHQYVYHVTRYHRALKQRNALLKLKKLDGIEVWESELALSGAYIIKLRSSSLVKLSERSGALYKQLTGTPFTFTLEYSRQKNFSQGELHEKHRRNRDKELLLGYTLSGPHRDDFYFRLEGRELRNFASEGQQRGAIAALKLAEWEYLNSRHQERPLLLIDDIGVSLDAERQRHLMNTLPQFGQVFITSNTDLEISNSRKLKVEFATPLLTK